MEEGGGRLCCEREERGRRVQVVRRGRKRRRRRRRRRRGRGRGRGGDM